jgi:hypothetical protein
VLAESLKQKLSKNLMSYSRAANLKYRLPQLQLQNQCMLEMQDITFQLSENREEGHSKWNEVTFRDQQFMLLAMSQQ